MTLFDNLLTVFILLVIAVIIYCRIQNKSLTDVFKEIKGIFEDKSEEVIQK